MRVLAIISGIVTALAGGTLFGIWLSRGGLRRQGAGQGSVVLVICPACPIAIHDS
jgi:hypothetical protein